MSRAEGKEVEFMSDIFMASCPVCGRSLFKGKADSYIEGGCPKCKNYLIISFTDNGFTATVSEKSPAEMNVTTK